MIDLYTALNLCKDEETIFLFGEEYTHKKITEMFDLRKYKVTKIYFDRWHGCLRFETKRQE